MEYWLLVPEFKGPSRVECIEEVAINDENKSVRIGGWLWKRRQSKLFLKGMFFDKLGVHELIFDSARSTEPGN